MTTLAGMIEGEEPTVEDAIAEIIDSCSGDTADMATAIAALVDLGMDIGEASNTLCEVMDAGITYSAWLERQ